MTNSILKEGSPWTIDGALIGIECRRSSGIVSGSCLQMIARATRVVDREPSRTQFSSACEPVVSGTRFHRNWFPEVRLTTTFRSGRPLAFLKRSGNWLGENTTTWSVWTGSGKALMER
jgi:hypothetical protein